MVVSLCVHPDVFMFALNQLPPFTCPFVLFFRTCTLPPLLRKGACCKIPIHTNFMFMPTSNCWAQLTATTYKSDNCVMHAVLCHAPPVNQHIKLSLLHMLHWMHTFLFIHYSNFIAMRSALHLVFHLLLL